MRPQLTAAVVCAILLGPVCALSPDTLSIMSYNIMDSGFADESGRYDPVGNRVPGNLTNFMAAQAPFVDVLGLIETGSWSDHDTSAHPGFPSIAASWGYEHVHVRGNCALMSHAPLTLVDEPSVGRSTIVARVRNTTFIVTSMSAESYRAKYVEFSALGAYVAETYADEPLVLMGDLNAVSPQDAHRYNATLLCGNGTYDAAAQTGEYVENYCLAQFPDRIRQAWQYDETAGIKWCSGVDCLIDTSGQCGTAQADLFGAGVNNNCVLFPRSMNDTEQVAAAEAACSGAKACAGSLKGSRSLARRG